MNHLFSRLSSWLKKLPVPDPVDRQMAALLQVILLGFMGIIFLAGLINLLLPASATASGAIVLRTSIFLLIVGFPLFLLRRGYFHGAVFIIIAIFMALETFAVLTTNLRAIAETLTFFTFAIVLAGLLVGRRSLYTVLAFSVGVISLNVVREADPILKQESIVVVGNFILLNGLMAVFLDRFGITLRTALRAAHERELDLQAEIGTRKQAEANLQRTTDRLELLHEIDRALLSAHSMADIARNALTRVRRLVPCPRASVTLFDLEKDQAYFLEADFDGKDTLPRTPLTIAEFGQRVVDTLQRGQPWRVEDILTDPEVTEFDRRLAQVNGIHAWLCLPLLYQGQLIGSLNLGRGPGGPFSLEEADFAQDVANQLAIILQQTRLYNSLQEQLVEREELIRKLEASNAELERFTYTVSHDLRNPLVTIKGFLGMLDRDIQEQRQDKIQDDFKRISGAADKMDALLSELLELSRIGRIVNPPEEVNFAELAHEAIELLDARLRAARVSVTISPDLPAVFGDRIRLREVLENLIDNSAKYMGDQPEPHIEIGVHNTDDLLVFFVKDNGLGIEPAYHTKIFGLFEKLDPAMEGTGIGLALVKRIIETHGGKIWVESEGPGKGATFCFTLPKGGNPTGR